MSRRILSVGYDQLSLTLRNWVLERAGYIVLPANSKAQALQLLQQQDPCELLLIAGSIPYSELIEIAAATKGCMPILWLFSGTREELPGITAYMPLLEGPEELLEKVRLLLAEPKPTAKTHHEKNSDWHPLLEKQQPPRPKRRA